MRDELKEKNTLIKSLNAPYTSTIEHKEQKTKELHENTIHEKNSINSKQTSKANNNMVSKKISCIDFHVNKLVPENDTAESNCNVLIPFPYGDENFPTKQLLVQ